MASPVLEYTPELVAPHPPLHIELKPPSTGDPRLDELLATWQHEQNVWDSTVLCAFETATGIDGVLNRDAFHAWLETPAARPAIAALESARSGIWISPECYQDAISFWRAAGKAIA